MIALMDGSNLIKPFIIVFAIALDLN